MHCFVGTIDDAHLFTSYFTEIKFGFTPIISRGNFLHTVIQQLDPRQILSETDSPYFIPEEVIRFFFEHKQNNFSIFSFQIYRVVLIRVWSIVLWKL